MTAIRRGPLLAAIALLCGCQSPAPRAAEESGEESGEATGALGSFTVAGVHFEQNATDGDAEVVFEVKGGDDGLTQLTVTAPDGRTVVDFTAPDAATLGMRQFRFESPEPRDFAGLAAAYPEGVYVFAGATAAGERLRAESRLSHRLPPPTSFLRPGAGARDVPVAGLDIAWTPVANLAAYVVYLEQDELGVTLTTRLPASVTRFAVPDGFLVPSTAYQLGIGTVTGENNASFVETTITTAAKE